MIGRSIQPKENLMHLYETHIPVTDLERSKKFYTEVVGLELAYEQPQRQVAFFWIGGP
ncbi:MAG: VOC family protein, partial [Anaerolineales bacterium]|nr:VOC family protein [Anaerolineales bacterium]